MDNCGKIKGHLYVQEASSDARIVGVVGFPCRLDLPASLFAAQVGGSDLNEQRLREGFAQRKSLKTYQRGDGERCPSLTSAAKTVGIALKTWCDGRTWKKGRFAVRNVAADGWSGCSPCSPSPASVKVTVALAVLFADGSRGNPDRCRGNLGGVSCSDAGGRFAGNKGLLLLLPSFPRLL